MAPGVVISLYIELYNAGFQAEMGDAWGARWIKKYAPAGANPRVRRGSRRAGMPARPYNSDQCPE